MANTSVLPPNPHKSWYVEYAHSNTTGSYEFIHGLTRAKAIRKLKALMRGAGLPRGTTLVEGHVSRNRVVITDGKSVATRETVMEYHPDERKAPVCVNKHAVLQYR